MRTFGVLTLAFSTVLASCFPACSKKQPPPAPVFSCDLLQTRSAKCEKASLKLIEERLKAKGAEASVDDSTAQYKMFKYRFEKKIRNQEPKKQCEKFKASRAAENKKRLARMRDCYAKQGCDAFAKCMFEL